MSLHVQAEARVDAAHARQTDAERTGRLLATGDYLAGLVLAGIPNLHELRRIAKSWRKQRAGGA